MSRPPFRITNYVPWWLDDALRLHMPHWFVHRYLRWSIRCLDPCPTTVGAFCKKRPGHWTRLHSNAGGTVRWPKKGESWKYPLSSDGLADHIDQAITAAERAIGDGQPDDSPSTDTQAIGPVR